MVMYNTAGTPPSEIYIMVCIYLEMDLEEQGAE
jgi:hypothetical protein